MAATSRSFAIWLSVYLLTIGGVIGGMYFVRQSTLTVYGSGAAQEEWDVWRDAASERTTGQGPVKQRPPKSVEPPALVLMRDHFAVCLALAVLLSSVLFVTFMFFARGVLQGQGGFVDRSNDARPRGSDPSR